MKQSDAAFFEAGRTYQRGRWQFQCLAVDTAPWDGQTRAAGFLLRSDGTGTVHGMTGDDWAHGEWTAVAKDGQSSTEAQHSIVITRAKLYPEVARPGPAWRWSYTYSVDGGPPCQYGTGLASLRDMLRRKFGTPGKEAWKS